MGRQSRVNTFHKLLVANRGEIACRVFRTARALGLKTVAVHSDADADALHVAMADESIRIGPPLAAESYLSIPAVLDAARRTGAGAIHPGYGFLSENADFAQACAEAGIVFVGPPADAIRTLGNKARAKRLAEEAGVRCIRGYQGQRQDDTSLLAEAKKIGFPLLIKAAAGGGGRGMRRVERESDLAAALAGARTEAKNAFGSDELILEELVANARHVEIQIIADAHGHCLSLGERDCSVQRRHQKIIEESPCPVMTESLREAMSEAARKAARAAGYVNAGTVEFLLDEKGAFYFLEVNTRLQVEHPVTELVTALDLVELQLRVARGEPLPLSQEEVRFHGHAIEARVYAEDPADNFRPQTGTIELWSEPGGPGIRVDHGLRTGSVISPYYDPMIAKVISHGRDRDEARTRLLAALSETVIFGVRNNVGFLSNVLEHPVFADGRATTAFLDEESLDAKRQPPDATAIAVACAALIEHAARDIAPADKGWRSTGPATIPLRLQVGDSVTAIRVSHRADAYTVTLDDGAAVSLTSVKLCGSRVSWIAEGRGEHARCFMDTDRIYLHRGAATHLFRDVTYAPPADAKGAAGGAIKSPVSGRVLKVHVAAGSKVAKSDVLVIVEAMKMENHVVAPRDGVVEAVHVDVSAQVEANQLLVTLAEENPPSEKAESKAS